MALSPNELDQIIQDILSIVREDITVELHTYYAEVVASVQRHPEQANKELRDAMTHLGRALVADSLEVAKRQVQSGRDHLERAKRDCLKMSLIFMNDRVQRLFSEVHMQFGTIAFGFTKRRNDLRIRRRQLAVDESHGRDNVTLKMLALLNDLGDLENDIIEEYQMREQRIRWYMVPVRWVGWTLRRRLVPLLVGLTIGVIASLTAIVLAPDAPKFSQDVRQFFGLAPAPPPSENPHT